MTRARERLILSGAARFAKWPSESATAMAWLGPALLDDLAARAVGGGAVVELQGAGDVPVALTLCTPDLAAALLWADELEPDAVAEWPKAPPEHADPLPNAPVSRRLEATDPTTLSYTAIAEYERCGYRYHLQREIGMPDAEPVLAGGEGAAARGVVVHALLEQLDFASARAPSEREVADAAALAGVALDPHEDRAALAALAGAFALADGELLRGFLDVVALEHDGTLLIVDYKSDRVADDVELATYVERHYSLQRLIYALAGIASGAPSVEVAHCFLRRPKAVLATRFAASERRRLEQLLAARLEPLRARRFEVSGDPNRERCGSCPGRARLCSHEESMTLREPNVGLESAAVDC
jgi:ATP-dependent exoDNAse (exonuclease V) beta subunit